MLFAGMWYAVAVKSITLGPAFFDALCMNIKFVFVNILVYCVFICIML